VRRVLSVVVLALVAVGFVVRPRTEAAPVPKSMKKPLRPLHPSVEKLLTLVSPPASTINPPTDADWADAEKELGTALPDEYKDLVTIYGEGYFTELCVWLYAPKHTEKQFRLVAKNSSFREAYRDGQSAPGSTYSPIFPDDDGYLFVGECAARTLFGYRPSGEPNEWQVLTYSYGRDTRYRESEAGCGLTDLLVQLAEGKSGFWLNKFPHFTPPMVFYPNEPKKK
jgi:hypothetical protein